jgi:replicative DNA helicase
MDALQQLLSNTSLEASLLAAFAADADLLWQWADRLPGSVFSEEHHRTLYEAQQEAALAGHPGPGLPGDVDVVIDPDGAAVTLLSLYQKRRLAALCTATLRKVREAADAGELLAALEGDLAALTAERGELLAAPLTAVQDLLPALWADLDARAAAAEGTGLPGIPTGFSHLDHLTGGLEAGLYLLAGPPKSGKTTLANQIAYQAAAKGVPVVYVSFENDPLDLLLKQVCRLSGQPLLKAQKGQADVRMLRQAGQRLGEVVGERLYYIAGGAETTVPKVRAKVKQALARHGAARGLVVIDYLQKMALVKQTGEMRDCVNRLSLQLRDLARDLDSPLLALASLSREGYGPGKRANLAALKESGNLEYDADAVWLLELGGEEKPGGLREVTLNVAAARRSPTGTVKMVLRSSCGQFVEVENER